MKKISNCNDVGYRSNVCFCPGKLQDAKWLAIRKTWKRMIQTACVVASWWKSNGSERNQRYLFYVRPSHLRWAVPATKSWYWKQSIPLKAKFFLERRELGVINIGGEGIVTVDGKEYTLKFKDALYVGRGKQKVTFKSKDSSKPANSTSTRLLPTRNTRLSWSPSTDAKVLWKQTLSLPERWKKATTALSTSWLLTTFEEGPCQLQMGLTELKPGSVWNTMPAHTTRRVEAYFYFNVPEEMPSATSWANLKEERIVWMQNEQAIMSPEWSIHAAAGTKQLYVYLGYGGWKPRLWRHGQDQIYRNALIFAQFSLIHISRDPKTSFFIKMRGKGIKVFHGHKILPQRTKLLR